MLEGMADGSEHVFKEQKSSIINNILSRLLPRMETDDSNVVIRWVIIRMKKNDEKVFHSQGSGYMESQKIRHFLLRLRNSFRVMKCRPEISVVHLAHSTARHPVRVRPCVRAKKLSTSMGQQSLVLMCT